MNLPWLALLSVLCNVGAQIAAKTAGRSVLETPGLWGWVNPALAVAIALYGVSFLITVKVFAVNPLSVAAPVMAGGTFVLVAVASMLAFGEQLGVARIAGMALILTGIVLLTRS